MKPFVIKQKCPAQSLICTAIKNCQYNAISYVEDEEEPLGGKIVLKASGRSLAHLLRVLLEGGSKMNRM